MNTCLGRSVLNLILACALMPVIAMAEPSKTERFEYDVDVLTMEVPTSSEAFENIESARKDKERRALAEKGWSAFTDRMNKAGYSASIINEIKETEFGGTVGNVMGDVCLALSLAQLNLDMHKEEVPPNTGLRAFKDLYFWAVGKYGWKTIRVSALFLQAGDMALTKLGQAGIEVRVAAHESAFNNYFQYDAMRHGPKGMSGKQWSLYFWGKGVTNGETAVEAAREYFDEFWQKGEAAVQEYYLQEQVEGRLDFVGRYLLKITGDINYTTPTSKDRKAIEDEFIRTHLAAHIEQYFTRDRALIIRRKAQIKAANDIKAQLHKFNLDCAIKVQVVNKPKDAAKITARIGPWTYDMTHKKEWSLRMTRHSCFKYVRHKGGKIEVEVKVTDKAGKEMVVTRNVQSPADKFIHAVIDLARMPGGMPEESAGAVLEAAVKKLGLPWRELKPIGDGSEGYGFREKEEGKFLMFLWSREENGAGYRYGDLSSRTGYELAVQHFRDVESFEKEWADTAAYEPKDEIEKFEANLTHRGLNCARGLTHSRNKMFPQTLVSEAGLAVHRGRWLLAAQVMTMTPESTLPPFDQVSPEDYWKAEMNAYRANMPKYPYSGIDALIDNLPGEEERGR